MTAVDETTELEHSIRDQSRRAEDLREQLRKAQYSLSESKGELEEVRSRANFHRNNYVYSKKTATLVDIAEFKANLAAMRSSAEALEYLRSSIAGHASRIERIKATLRQVDHIVEACRARLKAYGRVVQFTKAAPP